MAIQKTVSLLLSMYQIEWHYLVSFLAMNKHIIGRLGIDVNITSTVTNNLHLPFLCDSNTRQLTNHSTALGLLTLVHDYHHNSHALFTIIYFCIMIPTVNLVHIQQY